VASPTSRSLEYMREQGYVSEVVERWIPGANIRRDLWGFADLICLRGKEIVAVQTTSGSNLAARVKKIAEHENVGIVREAGIRILAHGWSKRASGKWELREVDCS
jgi:hypothetical protein